MDQNWCKCRNVFGNNEGSFHLNRFTTNENITRSIMRATFFYSHCRCIGPHRNEADKERAHELRGPTEVKAFYVRGHFTFMGPFACLQLKGCTEVNFKHGGSQKFFDPSLANLLPPHTFKMMVLWYFCRSS